MSSEEAIAETVAHVVAENSEALHILANSDAPPPETPPVGKWVGGHWVVDPCWTGAK